MFKNRLVAIGLAALMACLLACGENNIGSLIQQEAENIVFPTEEDPNRDYNPHMNNLSPAEMPDFIIKSLKEENSIGYFKKKVVDIQVTIPNSSEQIEGYRNTDYSKIIYYKKQDEIRRISGLVPGIRGQITLPAELLTITEPKDVPLAIPQNEAIIREYQIVGTVFELIPTNAIIQAKLEEGQTYILRVRITDILLQPISVGNTSAVYYIECLLWDDSIFQVPEPEAQQNITYDR